MHKFLREWSMPFLLSGSPCGPYSILCRPGEKHIREDNKKERSESLTFEVSPQLSEILNAHIFFKFLFDHQIAYVYVLFLDVLIFFPRKEIVYHRHHQ